MVQKIYTCQIRKMSKLTKNNTLQIYLMSLICFIFLLLPNKSFADYDACKLITKMLEDGCNITFEKVKGKFIKGYGIVGDSHRYITPDGRYVYTTEKYMALHCEDHKGMIAITGDFIAYPKLRRGDKVHFSMGKAHSWRWNKYIDTNEEYIRITIKGGRINLVKKGIKKR